MTRRLVASVAAFLAVAREHQQRTASWSTGTTNEFWLGLGLVAVSTAALVAYVANALRALQTATSDRDIAGKEAEQRN